MNDYIPDFFANLLLVLLVETLVDVSGLFDMRSPLEDEYWWPDLLLPLKLKKEPLLDGRLGSRWCAAASG